MTTLRIRLIGWSGLLSLLAGTLFVAGCGPSAPETVPVTGKISFEGKPVTQGTIMFIPEQGGRPATSPIQPDGSYALTTDSNHKQDGASLGKHTVTILSRKAGKPNPKNEPQPGDSFLEMERKRAADTRLNVEWLVPEIYAHRNSTPLTAEVVGTAENKIIFSLSEN